MMDIAKGNHVFAHAADGEIITGVVTSAPPSWGGSQPDRLRPLAEELGMDRDDGSPGPGPGSGYDSDYDYDYDLGDLEILLLIAEVAFGLCLDEAELDSPLLKVPDQPADPALRARPRAQCGGHGTGSSTRAEPDRPRSQRRHHRRAGQDEYVLRRLPTQRANEIDAGL
jgi:hypothetical protein